MAACSSSIHTGPLAAAPLQGGGPFVGKRMLLLTQQFFFLRGLAPQPRLATPQTWHLLLYLLFWLSDVCRRTKAGHAPTWRVSGQPRAGHGSQTFAAALSPLSAALPLSRFRWSVWLARGGAQCTFLWAGLAPQPRLATPQTWHFFFVCSSGQTFAVGLGRPRPPAWRL